MRLLVSGSARVHCTQGGRPKSDGRCARNDDRMVTETAHSSQHSHGVHGIQRGRNLGDLCSCLPPFGVSRIDVALLRCSKGLRSVLNQWRRCDHGDGSCDPARLLDPGPGTGDQIWLHALTARRHARWGLKSHLPDGSEMTLSSHACRVLEGEADSASSASTQSLDTEHSTHDK